MMGWQWHQLDHMQIIRTSLQTDNHASISSLSSYRPGALPAAQPTASKHCSRPITLLMFNIGSRPSDHYFRSVCCFVCLFVCAEFFSAVFDPISIKLEHMLYVWV